MNNLLRTFAEYPVLIGIAFFLSISLLLAFSLGVLMRGAGISLKPPVFLLGFFFPITAVPQMVVHMLDALVHAHQIRQQSTRRELRSCQSLAMMNSGCISKSV